MCERCGEQLKSNVDYLNHKEKHNLGLIPNRTMDDIYEEERLAGLPPESEAIIADPIIEKPNLRQQATPSPSGNATDPPDLGKIPSTGTATAAQWRAKKGIALIYKYDGYCDCGFEVDTLTLDEITDDKKKVVVVAWCNNCKKKLQQRTVTKL
jgi:hypothetical protein